VNTTASKDQPVSITNAEISRNVNDDATYLFGLSVESNGAITLTNVWANENGDSGGDFPVGQGAYLTNSSSSKTPGVTLTNVYFNGNYGNLSTNGNGLRAYSNGAITLRNIEANDNSGYGVRLRNNFSGSTGGISITRTGSFTNHFDRNGDSGIAAQSNGTITLANSEVGDSGVNVDDYGIYLANNDSSDTVASTVKVSDTSVYNSGEYVDPDYFGAGGLAIFARGAVILNRVYSSGNIGLGIGIDNTGIANQNVTLTEVSVAANSREGLVILTTGNVVGKGLIAFANGYEDNRNGATINTNSTAAGYGSVTLSGANIFTSNTAYGLQVDIANYGNLSLTGVTAETNVSAGVSVSVNHASNAGTVTLKNFNVNYNQQAGLEITARNTVLLDGIYALNNGTAGNADGTLITQNNTAATTTVRNSVFTGNTDSGLEVDKNGGLSPVITNTIYFGNDVNNDGGVLDIDIHD
jgi:hypothetical protein